MRLLWTAVLLCAHHVLGFPRPNEVPYKVDSNFLIKEHPDFFFELLQSTYKTKQYDASPAAGEPLILTPYILSNQTSEARNAARVDPDQFLGIESYAGYLTVNKEYNSNIWFWYIPVADKPVQEVPWIMWLQGGPGVSSLFGLFTEIGPFNVTDCHLEKIKYSWGQNHSLLFFDNPVGTGFSFTKDERGYSTNQTTIGENLYTALQQFLTIFPELRTVPLTIAGESYAGKHIPSIGIQILRNKNEAKPINLQGLAIGNGFIDPPTLTNYSKFLLEVGMVDEKVALEIEDIEVNLKRTFEEGDMFLAFHRYFSIMRVFLEQTHLPHYNIYNYMDDSFHEDLDNEPFIEYIQKYEVRRALHVGNSSIGSMRTVYSRLVDDMMNSARPWLEELLENYRVMLYNGHLDVIVGYRPSVNTYNALNFSGAAEYRKDKRRVWRHNNITAGYYKIGGNLMEVMVRGAGHMVPSDKPSAALGLISAFARGISLERDTGYLVDDKPDSPY